VVLRAHERLEVAPRLAGDEAEELAVLFPKLRALREDGLAQAIRDEVVDYAAMLVNPRRSIGALRTRRTNRADPDAADGPQP